MLVRLDERLKRYAPTTLVGGTLVSAALLLAAHRLLSTPWDDVKAAFFARLMAVAKMAAPGALAAEASKMKDKLRHELHKKNLGRIFAEIPSQGVPMVEVLQQLRTIKAQEDEKWQKGRCSGAVYLGEKAFGDFLNEVYVLFSSTNALHPDIWPSLRKFESEVIAMTVRMLRGGPEACGLMTSGGTESIVMACKTYRDWGRATKGITRPEMVAPITAHAAFDKGASYLGIKVHWIPVRDDFTVDVAAAARAINANTVMLVASAPGFAHGTIDDVTAMGQLALRHGVGLHVDSCLGGFLLPWLRELGHPIPPFDLSVPGVTSISADSHKYGYAQKGSSLLLFSSPSYRKYTWFCTVNWPGGIYASPSFQGSRPGGLVAATWASLVAMGQHEFRAHAEQIYQTSVRIREGVARIPGLFLLGSPPAMVIAWGSNEVNIYAVNDRMAAKGWSLNPIHRPAGMVSSFIIVLPGSFIYRQPPAHLRDEPHGRAGVRPAARPGRGRGGDAQRPVRSQKGQCARVRHGGDVPRSRDGQGPRVRGVS